MFTDVNYAIFKSLKNLTETTLVIIPLDIKLVPFIISGYFQADEVILPELSYFMDKLTKELNSYKRLEANFVILENKEDSAGIKIEGVVY